MNERKSHWLRANEASRLPRRVICFDCESYQNRKGLHATHEFRLASATFNTLSKEAQVLGKTESRDFDRTDDFWGWVSEHTSPVHRTVAFAHNLAYDLRVSAALLALPALGFRCKGIALTPYSTWARFHDGKRSLWLVDSLSFIPAPLERIASVLRIDKPPLPDDNAPNAEWLERCRGDVRTTRIAVLRVLRWLHDNDLGDFRTTGAGQAMAAYRHRFMPKNRLLVHADTEGLKAERRACWVGRSEVWQWGKVNELIYEVDFNCAYAHIAKEHDVPISLNSTHGSTTVGRLLSVARKYAVAADVEITTEVPTVPASHDGGIVWPVGRFQTTLWNPEIQLALEEGAKVDVKRYWTYRKAPVLRTWADWILDCLAGNGGDNDPVLQFTLKDWSRALIGRFGLRYSEWESIGELPSSDVVLYQCSDTRVGRTVDYLQIGTDLSEATALKESPNSMPSVMGYIMSVARVKLWEVMKDVGFGNFYYCDTDGLLMGGRGRQSLNAHGLRHYVPPLRHKTTWNGGNFRAPRNIDLGDTRRVNGAPRKSERLAHSTYRGEIWESLPTALKRHRPDTVLVTDRVFQISDRDRRRVHLPNGRTEPIRLG